MHACFSLKKEQPTAPVGFPLSRETVQKDFLKKRRIFHQIFSDFFEEIHGI